MPDLTEKLTELDEGQLAAIYKRIFDSPDGQLMLEDLKNRCFVKTTPFTGHNSETNFNSGMQAVVLHIQTQINYKPEPKQEE